jgi:hypothetical protein
LQNRCEKWVVEQELINKELANLKMTNMNNKFPKRKNTDITAETGINIVSTIFNDYFGWVFRRTHQENDFGVDAYIDYVTDDGSVTGKFIAAQVKTGKSYLSLNGNVHWYRDSKEHLNYFLNLPTPILLIICDPEKRECYWECLDKNKVDFLDDGWRHPIPKSQILSKENLNKIKGLFGEIKDHLSDFEQDYELLKLITDDSFIQYSIPKEDIESRNIKNLKSFLEKITRNEKLTLAVQGKLYICTYGYENDSREVHQIKPVRRWATKARKKIKEWYLCTSDERRTSTLLWLAACTCNIKSKLVEKPDGPSGYLIEGDPKELCDFLIECFAGLNEATEKWGWSKEYQYGISKKMHDELFPEIPYPELKE